MHFVGNLENCREYSFLWSSAKIITILHRGVHRNLLQSLRGLQKLLSGFFPPTPLTENHFAKKSLSGKGEYTPLP